LDRNGQEKIPVESKKRPILLRLGIGLVVASFILYGGILLVPFLPFSGKAKIFTGTALAVLGEVSFWVGGIILGKEVLAKYKKKLNPLNWVRKGDR